MPCSPRAHGGKWPHDSEPLNLTDSEWSRISVGQLVDCGEYCWKWVGEGGPVAKRDTAFEISLLIMRLATAAFLLVWAIDKVVSPDHAQAVFSKFYDTNVSPGTLAAVGAAQMIVVAFAAGAFRTWSYGAVLLMHAVSTASTFRQLMEPWGPGASLLFWAAVPVLAGMIALFALRSRDRLLSIDAWRHGAVS